MSEGNNKVARILYKEIVPGDIRKILAQSNDSRSGGGARDFRFGSYNSLLPVIQEMFPNQIQQRRKRGILEQIDVFQGEFFWHNSKGGVERKKSFFEPPTDARPSEGRIVRVHEYECFDTNLLPKGGEGNRVLLLLIQLYNKAVWPYYAEEESLRTKGRWDPVVANEILSCLDAGRAPNRAVIGYRDFTSMDRYCNGK